MTDDRPLILLIGATGYVGGRLLPALERDGRRVRCLVRNPDYLSARAGPGTEIAPGDLENAESVARALEEVDTVLLLARPERHVEELLAAAARDAGVRRFIHLRGLEGGDEPGLTLRSEGVPTIELRTSVVIGSGSLTFEVSQALIENSPFIAAPTWARTPVQPIAVEDLIAYLVASLSLPAEVSGVFEIGGADRASFVGILLEIARQKGLRHPIMSFPGRFRLVSRLVLGLITPANLGVAGRLMGRFRERAVVEKPDSNGAFDIRPRGLSEAIARALRSEGREFPQSRWCDSLASRCPERTIDPSRLGKRIIDTRTVEVDCTAAEAFRSITRLGGGNGWYYANPLWTLRGVMDLLAGGVGMRGGRRDPDSLRRGEAVDFWRVEELVPDRLLRLSAEMRMPGRAWLQFEVDGTHPRTRIRQTAIFDPSGFSGLAYWYSTYPFHGFIFDGMLRGIAEAAHRS